MHSLLVRKFPNYQCPLRLQNRVKPRKCLYWLAATLKCKHWKAWFSRGKRINLCDTQTVSNWSWGTATTTDTHKFSSAKMKDYQTLRLWIPSGNMVCMLTKLDCYVSLRNFFCLFWRGKGNIFIVVFLGSFRQAGPKLWSILGRTFLSLSTGKWLLVKSRSSPLRCCSS